MTLTAPVGFDLEVGGRRVHGYDTGGDGPVVVWQHGTPNLGTPPVPLRRARPEVRWLSLDRPGYGTSTSRPGRTVGDVAEDVGALVDARGVRDVVVAGHSGGAPHALALAARLGARVTGVLAVAGLAPFEGPRFFDGMGPHGRTSLGAARSGREAKVRFEAAGGSGGVDFTDADLAALAGEWGWFEDVVAPAIAGAVDGVVPGLVDDDVAYVTPWGVDLADVTAPVVLLHGEDDRIVPAEHARTVAARLHRARSVDLRIVPGAGHLSVLHDAAEALDGLLG